MSRPKSSVIKGGPKARTAKNSPGARPTASLWHGFAPPADLDAPARAEFDRLKSALSRLGRLECTEPRLVVICADLHSMIERTRAALNESTLTLTLPNGCVMAHPMIGVMNTLTLRLRGALKDLGLGARETKHAAIKSDAAESPWDGILNVAI